MNINNFKTKILDEKLKWGRKSQLVEAQVEDVCKIRTGGNGHPTSIQKLGGFVCFSKVRNKRIV